MLHSPLFIASLTLVVFSGRLPGAEPYWPPGKEWATVAPADVGMDQAKLDAAVKYAMSHHTKGLLVLRGGKIVAESYADGWDKDKAGGIASATKSMVSILVGIALDEGKFKSVDQPLVEFAPQLKDTEQESLTLRHLLTMTSGLSPQGAERLGRGNDQFAALWKMKLQDKPGTVWRYNTPAYHTLFRLIEKATGQSLDDYSRQKLFAPLGLEHASWVKVKTGDVTNYFHLECSTRDLGRFGLFAQRGGAWDGKQLVSKDYFQLATSPSQKLNPDYGFLWWLNANDGPRTRPARRSFPGLPMDLIAAMGREGQYVLVVPSLDLVVIRQGDQAGEAAFATELLKQVKGSIK
jgi:CubicO group peptidase (beta-lactamase class C family)